MKLLHIADVHLDRPFARSDRRAGDADRERLRDAFRRCMRTAAERQVDAVTIGGDLWEDEQVSADTRRFVAAELERLGRPVLMVTGNHDPLLEGGNYERTEWPENVHLFDSTRPAESRLSEEVSVWGMSWTHREPDRGALQRRAAPDDGRAHILLLHGTATTFAELVEDSGHYPFDPSQVGEAGFSLCLAGHIHAASHQTDVVYPGSLEPLGWGEMGRHCMALVEVEGGAARVELIDANSHAYREAKVDCSGATHGAECEERLEEATRGMDGEALHLRAILEGEVARDCKVDAEQIADRHRARFAELQVVDRTAPAYDLDERAAGSDATGHFVRMMRERIDAESDPGERRILEQALDYGVRALDGREVPVRVD